MATPEEELQKLKVPGAPTQPPVASMTGLGGAPEGSGTLNAGALGGAKPPANPAQSPGILAPPPAAPPAAPSPMNAAPGAPPAAAPAAAAAPPAAAPAGGPIDPNTAAAQLKGEFSKKFGREISEAEIAGLQKNANWKPGDPITPDVMARMSQLIGAYTGDPNNPGAIPPAPGSAPAAPAPVSEGEQTGNLTDQMLRQLIGTGSLDSMSNVDMNSPAIQAQRQNFDRANNRATTQERLAAAERAAARGSLGAGGYDAGLQSIEQSAGDRRVGFESQLMTGELQGQRERVMKGLELAQKSGSEAQQRALQKQLGELDAAIRREGIGSQEKLGQGQLSLGLLGQLLGNQQSRDALGFNYAQLGQQGKQFDLSTILNNLG